MVFFQSKHLWVKQLDDGVAVLTLDREQSPLNYLDPDMLDEIEHALDAITQANVFRLLVIRSGKPANFCHGATTALLATWKKDDFTAWTECGQRVCSKLADMTIPSICVIGGGCFDAGLELAMACDHRVVIDRPTTSLGFPELEWGMIPCWGGTQRLPRVIGLDNSLQMLLAGQRLDAREAWRCNLADDLAQDDDEAPIWLANPRKRDWSTFPARNWRERWLESNRPGRWFLCRGAERILRTRIPEGMPAQAEMLHALRRVYELPSVAAGLETERQALDRVVEQPALSNLLRLLMHRETLRLPAIAASEKGRITQVGVIGGGPAGMALLLQCVITGYEVVLRTEDEDTLGAGISQIVQLLGMEVKRGALTDVQLHKALGSIRGTFTWNHFDKLHLIVDTTDDELDVKQQLYREIEQHVAASTLLVPIPSQHRIADLQQGLRHPARVIGLHIIEPWNRSSLAEIVAPPPVTPANAQRVREWALSLGKCCLQVPDKIGGLAMRVWLPALNEAGLMVKEGVAIDRIDRAMRRFGMSYGPCEWMDRLGIDTIAGLASALQPQFDGRLTFESGFSLMVEKLWLGNQSELGFYQPGFRKRKPHRDAVQLWLTQSQGEAFRPVPSLSDADFQHWIQNRLVTLMVLEAIRCVDEGMVNDADDLDCALCLTGWASHRGGPIGYARSIGIEALSARCAELAREYGPRYEPPSTIANFLASLSNS
jgi:3-hydroxyacyl-CoA dehydrogenase / enoyl-CoA hydratase / 3-hydroxybutyryl-CoA epimerase